MDSATVRNAASGAWKWTRTTFTTLTAGARQAKRQGVRRPIERRSRPRPRSRSAWKSIPFPIRWALWFVAFCALGGMLAGVASIVAIVLLSKG